MLWHSLWHQCNVCRLYFYIFQYAFLWHVHDAAQCTVIENLINCNFLSENKAGWQADTKGAQAIDLRCKVQTSSCWIYFLKREHIYKYIYIWIFNHFSTRVSKSFVLYVLSTEAKVYCPSKIMFNWRRLILTSFINLIKSRGVEMNFLMLCSEHWKSIGSWTKTCLS